MKKVNSYFFLVMTILVLGGCQSKALPANDMPAQKTSFFESDLNVSRWNVYTSEKYGFSMRYPDEYRVDELLNLQGTNSEHFSIDFSKGAEHGSMKIIPESAYVPRVVGEPNIYHEIINQKKVLIEQWPAGNGGDTANVKFLDIPNKWNLCDQSEFCTHITFFGYSNLDSWLFMKMIETIEFKDS